jgi:hypothetical protein
MYDELVEFLKRSFVEQKLDPFARRHLSGFMLFFNARCAATLFSLGAAFA